MKRVTPRQAERAARQLMFHQRRIEWIEEKIEENESLLARFVQEVDLTVVRVGNFEVFLAGEKPLVIYNPTSYFEQLVIEEVA